MTDITPTLSTVRSSGTITPNKTNTQRTYINGKTADRIEKVNNSAIKEKSERMLLSLLKTGLSGEELDKSEFLNATKEDWKKVLELGNESSVTAILLDGAEKLPKNSIPHETLIEMLTYRANAEKEHAKRLQIISELTEKFDKRGVDTVHLKGIGFSMNYPKPNHRFGCDIDIFTRLHGQETTNLSNSYNIADGVMIEEGLEVGSYNNPNAKHSEFRYNGVEVDNHKYFIAKKQFPYAAKLDEYLHKNLKPHEQLLPNGKKVLVPSKEFNTIFISHHAFQHHVINELNLHHLTDWSMHVKNNGLELPEEAKGTPFEKFTYALTNLSNRYLGTNVKVPEDRKYEDKLMQEIIHPKWIDKPSPELNNFELLIHKTKRCFKNAKRSHELGGYNTFAIFGKAALHKLLNPTTLFVR